MPTQKLTIVIPVYRGVKQLGQCLSALRNSQYQYFSTIVVDHGKTDDISRFVATDFPDVIRLRGSPELWWSGATNLGVKHALANNGQFIMLLNHDCFVRPDTINQLLDASELRDTTIIAPVQINSQTGKRTIKVRSCMLLGFPTLILPSLQCTPGREKIAIEANLIIGGRGVIISSKIFRQVGLFDEKHLPHYGADHDFYFRCRNNGIKLYICCNSIVDVDNTSSSRAEQIAGRSFAEFVRTLRSTHSHRNIHDLSMLFKRHYPVKWLWSIGVGLNVLRYFFSYMLHSSSR